MKSKLNLECLSERITPSVGVDNPGTTGYSIPAPPAPAGPPSGLYPTRQEALDHNNKVIDELNALSDKVADLMLDLAVNKFNQDSALKRSIDPNLSAADRAAAAKELEALKKEHGELVDKLRDAVYEYNRIKNELKEYNRLPGYSDEPKPLEMLPEGYEKYVPRTDIRNIT